MPFLPDGVATWAGRRNRRCGAHGNGQRLRTFILKPFNDLDRPDRLDPRPGPTRPRATL